MLKSDPQRQELTLPAEALVGLREILTEELGAEGAARVLRRSGAAAGRVLAPLLAGGDPDALRALPGKAFWRRFADLLGGRGWGRLQQTTLDNGTAALDANDWAEARSADQAEDVPGCHFSAGMLTSLLGFAAGAEIAVREVECRRSGDERCRFVFGAPARVAAAYPDAVAPGRA